MPPVVPLLQPGQAPDSAADARDTDIPGRLRIRARQCWNPSVTDVIVNTRPDFGGLGRRNSPRVHGALETAFTISGISSKEGAFEMRDPPMLNFASVFFADGRASGRNGVPVLPPYRTDRRRRAPRVPLCSAYGCACAPIGVLLPCRFGPLWHAAHSACQFVSSQNRSWLPRWGIT
jgi:hypothetical protein